MAESTVRSTKNGSLASDRDSDTTRQTWATVIEPNIVPVIQRYALIVDSW